MSRKVQTQAGEPRSLCFPTTSYSLNTGLTLEDKRVIAGKNVRMARMLN